METGVSSVATAMCPISLDGTVSHVFIYSGSLPDRVPEGMPCLCGQTYATYETCDKCGNEKLIPKKLNEQ